MRLLLVDQYAGRGGGQEVFLTLLDHARQSGHTVTAAFPPGGALAAEVRRRFRESVRVIDLPEIAMTRGRKRPRDVAVLTLATARTLMLGRRLGRFDAYWINGAQYFVPFWLLSRSLGVPAVYHVHLDHAPVEKRLIAALLASPTTRAVVFNSRFTLERFTAEVGGGHEKVRLLENALPARLAGRRFRDRFQADVGRRRFGTVGRVSREKGQDRVVELAGRLPESEFYVIGDHDFTDPSYLRDLRKRAPANVHFTGSVSDVSDCLDSLGVQVSIVPSRWREPFGLVAIESMADSCLTVVARSGELENIARRTGALSFSTLEELAGIARRLIDADPASLAEQARLQHERTMELYAPERFRDRFLEILQEAPA